MKMQEAMIKVVGLLLLWSWSFVTPLLSALASVVVIFHFLTMIKRNVINPDYDRSWKKFIKATFKHLKK